MRPDNKSRHSFKQNLQSRDGSSIGTATKSVASSRERSNLLSQHETKALNVYTKKTEIVINPQQQVFQKL